MSNITEPLPREIKPHTLRLDDYLESLALDLVEGADPDIEPEDAD